MLGNGYQAALLYGANDKGTCSIQVVGSSDNTWNKFGIPHKMTHSALVVMYDVQIKLNLLIVLLAMEAGKHHTYSAYANSCHLQTDTFLFPLSHNH